MESSISRVPLPPSLWPIGNLAVQVIKASSLHARDLGSVRNHASPGPWNIFSLVEEIPGTQRIGGGGGCCCFISLHQSSPAGSAFIGLTLIPGEPNSVGLREGLKRLGTSGLCMTMSPSLPRYRCLSLARRWRPSRCAVACLSTPQPLASPPWRPVPTVSLTSCVSPTLGCPMAVTCPRCSTSALWVSGWHLISRTHLGKIFCLFVKNK